MDMGLGALLQAVVAVLAPLPSPPPDALAGLTARDKARLVVVSGLPAPPGVAGVIVQPWSRGLPRPKDALVFVDQEGGETRAFADLPPGLPPSAYRSARAAHDAGRATGRGLRRAGVDVDLAPVLDGASGPLGSRHFAEPKLGLAFARGLARGGVGSCVKHFPGLGTAAVSTDESPHVRARLTRDEVASFAAALRAGVPCVMVSHAEYRRLGRLRASFSPGAYRMLRRLGFEGVAMTDSVSVFGSAWAVRSALLAARAGADLVLFTNGRDAARAVRALVPLARRGLLDDNVERVLDLRHAFGLGRP
jgi:beta-N-acetylhexosaminidase